MENAFSGDLANESRPGKLVNLDPINGLVAYNMICDIEMTLGCTSVDNRVAIQTIFE